MNLVELPLFTLRQFGDAADKRGVAAARLRISPHHGKAALFGEDLTARGNGGEFFHDGRSGGATHRQMNRTSSFRTCLEFLRRTVSHHAAAVDDDHARAGCFDFFEDVCGENDRLFLAHALDESAHLVLLVGVEAVGRLVKNQDVRIMNDRLRQTGTVFVALRQGVDGLVEHSFEHARLNRAVNRLLLGVAGQAAQVGGKGQKTEHCHIGIARRVLRQIADQAFGGQRILDNIEAANGHPSRRRRVKARDDAHGCGFTGTVGPEKPEHFAALDAERNIVDRALGAERLHQIFNFDHYGPPPRQPAAAGSA